MKKHGKKMERPEKQLKRRPIQQKKCDFQTRPSVMSRDPCSMGDITEGKNSEAIINRKVAEKSSHLSQKLYCRQGVGIVGQSR